MAVRLTISATTLASLGIQLMLTRYAVTAVRTRVCSLDVIKAVAGLDHAVRSLVCLTHDTQGTIYVPLQPGLFPQCLPVGGRLGSISYIARYSTETDLGRLIIPTDVLNKHRLISR